MGCPGRRRGRGGEDVGERLADVVEVGRPEAAHVGQEGRSRDARGEALAPYAGAVPPSLAASGVTPATLGYLLFTSGTRVPQACRCSQGRLATIGGIVASMFALADDDVSYLAMPLFHSNALMAGWAPSLSAGAAVALPTAGRSRFDLPADVRRFGATYFNYVGKPLAYILATPPHDDDRKPIAPRLRQRGIERRRGRFAARSLRGDRRLRLE